jgi:hypothetical protein
MIAMRRAMLAVALISFTGVMPATYARADLPVIDVTAIADAVKAYAVQIQQLATEIKTWVTENLSWLTELKELEEDVQIVSNLVMMVDNFIHYPSLGTAMGLMNMAGLDLSLPVDPYAVQNLLTGYSGVHSITGLTGKLSSLSSLIRAATTAIICIPAPMTVSLVPSRKGGPTPMPGTRAHSATSIPISSNTMPY